MDRRGFLAGAAALSAYAGSARAGVDGLRGAAREAWLYGVPLIEMAGVRTRATSRVPPGGTAPLNAFVHAQALAGPHSRNVTTPNNDTLYSSAWIDLSGGPVTILVPATGHRYFSLALMDMFTNNIRVIGARSRNVDEPCQVILRGPAKRMGVGDVDIAEPRMPRPLHFFGKVIEVKSPSMWVWALGRTLVNGPDDLAAARTAQEGLTIHARHPARTPDAYPGRNAAWNDYFYAVQGLLWDAPPPIADNDFFHRIAPVQLGPVQGFEKARFADSELSEIEAGIDDARGDLAGALSRIDGVGGWNYPKPDLGDFGVDYLYRAATAVSGLAALPPTEAMYMRALAPGGGGLFDGAGHFKLSLPSAVPVDGFWSLTMYETTADGQFFLTENPIQRYAIGDRAPGLKRKADGGIDIWIGREDPGGTHTSNWLPAPAKGQFALSMRAYLPQADLLSGRYRLPAVQVLGAAPAPSGG